MPKHWKKAAIKLHCSVLAEEGIKRAVEDWEEKTKHRKHNQSWEGQTVMVIELTDGAISKAIERTETGNRSGIRLGVTGGGCAGFEYYIEYVESIAESDTVLDYGKFNIVVDAVSPYLEGSTLDWVVDGINRVF